EVVHVIPQYFRIDEEEVDNPLNMNGNRLEVAVYIVTAKRNALINIKSALKISGIDDVKFALDSYVSSLAVLDEQQRKFGAVVINVGSTTTEFVYFKGNSIVYNGFIPAGSKNITNDLSVMLHTPNLSAEKIKIEYGSLTRDYSANNEVGATKVTLPRTDDEDSYTEVALDYIQTIIHARVEEILVLVKNRLKKSALLDNIGSGIVLTGGMSCLGGIKELTKKIFEGIPVSVSTPKNLPNNFKISFDETNMSTVVGLLMYSLGINRSYQLDSGKKLIRPVRKERVVEKVTIPNMNNTMNTTNREYIQTKQNNGTVLEPLVKDKKKGVSGLWNKLSEWF
ncbi:cell division protein FtsA, partial [Aliarcobacter butzleri]|nr:cell division protein FtsA [Aliarcobacter butzleri]